MIIYLVLYFSSVVSGAMALKAKFTQLLEIALRVIAAMDIFLLRRKLETIIILEVEGTYGIFKYFKDLDSTQTPQDVLNSLVHSKLLGYLNYQLLKVFPGLLLDPMSKCELLSAIQHYENDHNRFLHSTDFNTLNKVFRKHGKLKPTSPAWLPRFTFSLESSWKKKNTHLWKDILERQFGWSDHVLISSIHPTRNCMIIEYSVLRFFAFAVVRDLTDPLVLAVLKRQGVTVELSEDLLKVVREEINPTQDIFKKSI